MLRFIKAKKAIDKLQLPNTSWKYKGFEIPSTVNSLFHASNKSSRIITNLQYIYR